MSRKAEPKFCNDHGAPSMEHQFSHPHKHGQSWAVVLSADTDGDVPSCPYKWFVRTQGARRHWSYEVTLTSGAQHVKFTVNDITHYLELPWSLTSNDSAKLPSKHVAWQPQMKKFQSDQEADNLIDNGESSRGGAVDEQSVHVQQASHEKPQSRDTQDEKLQMKKVNCTDSAVEQQLESAVTFPDEHFASSVNVTEQNVSFVAGEVKIKVIFPTRPW